MDKRRNTSVRSLRRSPGLSTRSDPTSDGPSEVNEATSGKQSPGGGRETDMGVSGHSFFPSSSYKNTSSGSRPTFVTVGWEGRRYDGGGESSVLLYLSRLFSLILLCQKLSSKDKAEFLVSPLVSLHQTSFVSLSVALFATPSL